MTVPAASAAQVQDHRLTQANSLRAAGDFERAIPLLEELQGERPDDPTTLRLLGSSYAAAARYEEALATLQRARTLAPADQDIALALGRTFLWAGRVEEAEAVARDITVAEPGNAELAAFRKSIERSMRDPFTRRPGLAVGYGISAVSAGAADRTWRTYLLALDAPVGNRTTVSGQGEVEDRNGISDTRLGIRMDRRVGKRDNLYAAFFFTPDARFREDASVRIGGQGGVSRNLVLSLDLRHAEYADTNVTVATPGVRLQSTSGAYGIEAKSIHLWSERDVRRSGWSMRADAEPASGWRFSAGGATYPDTEAGVTRRVRGAFIGAAIPVSSRLTARIVADYERRVDSYSRRGATIGLGLRL